MITFRQAAAVILVTTTLLTTSACSDSTNEIQGTYTAEYDATNILTDILKEQNYEIEAVGTITAPYRLSLTKNEYTIELDTDAYEQSFTEFLDNNIDQISTQMLVSMGLDNTEEDKARFIKITEFDTFEEFEEDLKQDLIKAMDFDNMDAQKQQGKYTYRNNTIKFKAENNFEGTVNEDGTITVSTTQQLTFIKD